MNLQRRQSPTCGLPYPGERDPELSSWGLLLRSRAVQANLSLGAQPGTWSSSAGLWGEQTPEATAGSKAEGLGCVALRYEEEAHRSAQRVHYLWCWRGLVQGTAAPCWNTELQGGRCCSSRSGEVRLGFHTAKWEKWYLVVLSAFPPS